MAKGSGKKGAGSGSGGKSKSPTQTLLAVMQGGRGKHNAYQPIADLRDKTGLSKAAFDAALTKLRSDWKITLHPAEGRHGVEQRLIDKGYESSEKVYGSDSNKVYSYASFRDDD